MIGVRQYLQRLFPQDTPATPKPKPSGHAGGGLDASTDLSNHTPSLRMVLYDTNTGKEMSKDQINSARQSGTLQPIFFNPMQSIDYRVIAAVTKNTIVGPLINQFTQFIVGNGFYPELELINPSGDSKKDQAELERYRHIIEELLKVQRHIDHSNDITFVEYVTMLIDACNTYGRGALVWDYASKYKTIPTTLKYAHPADLSITLFDKETWRLDSVLWQYGGSVPVKAADMIYLWNPLVSAKYQNAWQYGGSMILPMLDAARTLRKIVGVDFPAMASATWSGMFIMGVRPQGQNVTAKQAEYGAIAKNMVRGGPNILMENPEDLAFHEVDFAPKVEEFQKLTHFLIKYCVASLGLPQSMFFDEGESNRSTARSKIQLVMASTINPIRERLGRQLGSQTYQKWFETLYPDLTDTIRIRFEFKDLQISEWYDKIESALRLDSRHELTDMAFGDLVELPDYINQIKPDAPTNPGGEGERMHNLQRDMDGKNLDVGKSLNKEGME